MTMEEREQRWSLAMRVERRGQTVGYERMLKEVVFRRLRLLLFLLGAVLALAQ